MPTEATRLCLRSIVDRSYAGSQSAFSRACRLDPADTSRVLSGSRAATIGIVRRVVEVAGSQAGSELVAAFISDILVSFPAAQRTAAIAKLRLDTETQAISEGERLG